MMGSANISSFSESSLRVCRLSGVQEKVLERRRVSLVEYRRILENSIKECEKAERDHDYWLAAELGARAVLLVCDIIMMASSEVPGGGNALSLVYGFSKIGVDVIDSGGIRGKNVADSSKMAAWEVAANSAGNGRLKSTLDLSNQLVGLGESIWEFLDGTTTAGANGIGSASRGLAKQLRNIQRKIESVEKELAECGALVS